MLVQTVQFSRPDRERSGMADAVAFSVQNTYFLRDAVFFLRVERDKPAILAFLGQDDLPKSIREHLRKLLSPFYRPHTRKLTTLLPLIRKVARRDAGDQPMGLLALAPRSLSLLVWYTSLPLAKLLPPSPCLHALDRRRDPSSMALGSFHSLSSRVPTH
jgi:hypothetical protein